MSDINIIKLEKIILTPFRKASISISRGGIDKLYIKMYAQAEEIAIHEMKKYNVLLTFKNLCYNAGLGGEHQDISDIDDKVHKYRDERIQYHMNEMKGILFHYLEFEKYKALEESKFEKVDSSNFNKNEPTLINK